MSDLAKAALLLLPILAVELLFYLRWRRKRGGGSWLDYSISCSLDRKPQGGAVPPMLLKFAFVVLWFVAWSQIAF